LIAAKTTFKARYAAIPYVWATKLGWISPG
jgi:hypothetical protein